MCQMDPSADLQDLKCKKVKHGVFCHDFGASLFFLLLLLFVNIGEESNYKIKLYTLRTEQQLYFCSR